MRDEWIQRQQNNSSIGVDSRSSQGLTRRLQQSESGRSVDRRSGLDRSATLTMAHKVMKLKGMQGEVSERRQVGDAETVVNQPSSMDDPGKQPAAWWRNVGLEEGL